MGGTQSTTAIQQLSEQLTNVAMSTVQNCEVTATQSQEVVVNNSGFKFWSATKLEQKTDIKSECFSDVSKQTDLQNKIVQTISQSTSADGLALLGAFGTTNATATANLKNIVHNNVTMSNIQKSYNSIKQTQSATFNNSGMILFEQNQLTQGASIFAAATLTEVDKAGIFTSVATYVDQKADAKTENPLDFISKAIGAVGSSIGMTIIWFVVIIAAAILGLIVVTKTLGSSSMPSASARTPRGSMIPLPPVRIPIPVKK